MPISKKPLPKAERAEQAIEPDLLRRRKPAEEDTSWVKPPYQITAGVVDRVLDHVINPSRDAIRGVTVIDRLQGRLFPQLDMVNAGRSYCLEIAAYRQDREAYRRQYRQPKPAMPDLLDEYLFRAAQWQKSVGGKSWDKAMEIVLSEVEAQANKEDMGGSTGWGE